MQNSFNISTFCLFEITGCFSCLDTYQIPLLVPHWIIKELVCRAVLAAPERRSLTATLLVLLLCPWHLHMESRHQGFSFEPKQSQTGFILKTTHTTSYYEVPMLDLKCFFWWHVTSPKGTIIEAKMQICNTKKQNGSPCRPQTTVWWYEVHFFSSC